MTTRSSWRASHLVALAAVALLAGCGDRSAIEAGGRIVGPNVTVYSSLPDPARGVSRDMVDAEKLAIMQAHGRAGDVGINFFSVDEGAPGADTPPKVSGAAAQQVIRDPQVIASIGALRSDAALTEVPLYNAAGVLLVSPGAGYLGFTEPVAPGEPERWYPSGHQTFARVVGDDAAQADTLVRAAHTAGDRIAIESEAGKVPETLTSQVVRKAGQVYESRPDAVIYVGTDLRSAAGVAESLAREHPHTQIVFPDELTRAGVARLLPRAVRRRAIFVSSAPKPGSTAELRSFERAFQTEYGRAPDPYAVLGYRAMRRLLQAIGDAGHSARLRRVVAQRYLALPPAEDGFTAFRVRDGRRVYLR
jgi:ABC-type branched-subunit amino acid transport system substrate-binding protein